MRIYRALYRACMYFSTFCWNRSAPTSPPGPPACWISAWMRERRFSGFGWVLKNSGCRLPSGVVVEVTGASPSWTPLSDDRRAEEGVVILLPRAVRVYFATQPVNPRMSFDGLSNAIRHVLQFDPHRAAVA